MKSKGKITIIKSSDSMVELKNSEMNIVRGGIDKISKIPGCRRLCGRCLIRIGCNRRYGAAEQIDYDSHELMF
ncbi:MAG: hypothetical protein N4A74_01010 [Carboxylicivirga sp.]|jgi:hypothetical protein|nr:hypothetical protein [Carboxylicivirga sp.]